jgi:hypothetical protein
MRLTELAALVGLDKSTASRVVDGLVAKQLVARVESAEDRRAISVGVSARGRSLYQRIRANLVQEEAALMADLAPEVRQAAITLIQRLAAVAQRETPAPSATGCCPPSRCRGAPRRVWPGCEGRAHRLDAKTPGKHKEKRKRKSKGSAPFFIQIVVRCK